MKPSPQTQQHYVAYHSVALMGNVYRPRKRFTFHTAKSETFLRSAIGGIAWVLLGEREGKATRYTLTGRYTIDKLKPFHDRWEIAGEGEPLRIDITKLPWFVELRQEQANFSIGFSRIQSSHIIAALEALAQGKEAPVAAEPKAEKTAPARKPQKKAPATNEEEALLGRYHGGPEHQEVQQMLDELGKLGNHHVLTEHDIGAGFRADVVWFRLDPKEHPNAAPFAAFEIERGSAAAIAKSLSSLKHAFNLGASKLFLILPENRIPHAEERLRGPFAEIRGHTQIVSIEHVKAKAKRMLELKIFLGLH